MIEEMLRELIRSELAPLRTEIEQLRLLIVSATESLRVGTEALTPEAIEDKLDAFEALFAGKERL